MKGTKTQSTTDSRQTYKCNQCKIFVVIFVVYLFSSTRLQTAIVKPLIVSRALEVDQQYNHPHRLIPLKVKSINYLF